MGRHLILNINQGLLCAGILVAILALTQHNMTLMMQALILIAVVLKNFSPS